LPATRPARKVKEVAIPTNRRKRANRHKSQPKLHQATVAAKPSTTATKLKRAPKPAIKKFLSTDALKTICNALPGILSAVAKLIEALKGH
jgi:hypothetical protein